MRILSKIRLILAFALLILGMITLHAKENEETAKYMIYLDIRAELEAGDLTLEEAQIKWQKAITKLRKEEGK